VGRKQRLLGLGVTLSPCFRCEPRALPLEGQVNPGCWAGLWP
jgi:hypothetical protein